MTALFDSGTYPVIFRKHRNVISTLWTLHKTNDFKIYYIKIFF